MNKAYLLFLVIFLSGITIATFSKNTAVPGYIITLSNDTVEGFIDIKEKNINPNRIIFKNNNSDKGKYYSPANILGYGVSDEIYKSAIVKVEQSPYNPLELSPFSELEYLSDTVFLQALIIGKKELYYLQDAKGKEHFYIKIGSDYEWLIYKQYRKQSNNKTFLATNNKFIGQLILYLNECTSLNSILSASTYDKNSLINVFNEYYECTNSKQEYVVKKPKVKIKLSVLAGVSLTKLKFGGNSEFDYLTNTDFPTSLDFIGGISADLFLPRKLGRWSINNELTLTSYSTGASYKKLTPENWQLTTESDIAFTYIKLNNMLRGNFPAGVFKLFFDVGFSNGISIHSTNIKKETIEQGATTLPVVYDKAIDKTRLYEQSLLFGFGSHIKKFSATIRFEIGNGMSSYSNLTSRTNRYYIFLSYRII